MFNNKPGRDGELCERYHEPAWNNPVVRFFAPDGQELLERADGLYSADAVAGRLCAALAAAKRTSNDASVPAYLQLAREELAAQPLESAVFSMGCFWRGEGVLGSIPGVRSTRAGWLDGREVVALEYAPERIAFGALLKMARDEGCAERVWVAGAERLAAARALVGTDARALDEAPRLAQGKDHEYYLRDSAYSPLPLTPLQRVRINARLASGREAEDLLSPSQRTLLARVLRNRERVAGMLPPEEAAALWSYRAELEARLGE